MTREELITNLKYTMKKHENDTVRTFGTNISVMCKDVLDYLEQEPTTKNDLTLIHTEGLDEGIRCAMCTNSMQSDRGCDGSCVVNNAMYKEVMDVIENHIVDTDKIIEPTTKNDLGVDCISREQAKAAIRDKFKDIPSRVEINTILNELPSVTPQEPQIKVLERDEAMRKLGAVDIYQARAWITLLNDLEYLNLKICEVEE